MTRLDLKVKMKSIIKKIMCVYNSHCGNRVRQKFPIFCWDNHHDETSHMPSITLEQYQPKTKLKTALKVSKQAGIKDVKIPQNL